LKEKRFIPLFKVLTTHGLKGDLKVALLSLNSEVISNLKKVYFQGEWETPLEILEVKKGPGFNVFILTLKGIDYERAKNLTNKKLYVEVEELPPLEEGEYYYFQLGGLRVVDGKGRVWGKVIEVMPLGEYELLLIKDDEGGEFFLPLVEEYVEEVKPEEGVILVKDLKALVESQR